MKRCILLTVLVVMCGILPVNCEQAVKEASQNVELPNIFIWAIPDDNSTQPEDDKKSKKDKDVPSEAVEVETSEEEPIVLNATTLKGYAEYIEGADDILYMDNYQKLSLNIKSPEKISSKNLLDGKTQYSGSNYNLISKFKSDEYSISPDNRNFMLQEGNWTYGTSFGSEISTSQLERSTGLFTKYENKYFALSSNYNKNNMTTAQIQTDNVSVTPEFKFNNYISIKDVLSKDMTRNRRSSELIFSINPLGAKDKDRMRLNFGAKQTYDENTGNTWSQLNFTTNFKL